MDEGLIIGRKPMKDRTVVHATFAPNGAMAMTTGFIFKDGYLQWVNKKEGKVNMYNRRGEESLIVVYQCERVDGRVWRHRQNAAVPTPCSPLSHLLGGAVSTPGGCG